MTYRHWGRYSVQSLPRARSVHAEGHAEVQVEVQVEVHAEVHGEVRGGGGGGLGLGTRAGRAKTKGGRFVVGAAQGGKGKGPVSSGGEAVRVGSGLEPRKKSEH